VVSLDGRVERPGCFCFGGFSGYYCATAAARFRVWLHAGLSGVLPFLSLDQRNSLWLTSGCSR
jgi:hypothetical protein